MESSALFDLRGTVALVTGGSRGLGKLMAEGLAEAGASLVLCARRETWLTPTVTEFNARGFACLGVLADVTQPASVQALVAQALDRYGKIDILVNNAGVGWGGPVQEMPLERWRDGMEVNVTGAFLVTQAVGRHMLERCTGRIINVASLAGLRGMPAAVLDASGYSASKGALIAFTRDLAVKWAPHGVTVNAIAPGFFPTRMTEAVIQRSEAAILARIPMGRLGQPDDIKGLAVFLAAPASAYITGQVFSVDGGASAW